MENIRHIDSEMRQKIQQSAEKQQVQCVLF